MLNTKLILVDGITGSGKSTTAHFIARQLEKNGIKVRWIFEQEKIHPLEKIKWLEDESGVDYSKRMLIEYPKIWIDFVNSIKDDDCIYIIEAFWFQDILLFPHFFYDLNRQIIKDFSHQLCDIIRCLNPILIHFYQLDVDKSLQLTWERRGSKEWYIEQHADNLYCKNRGLKGEEAVIKIWQDFSDFTLELFAEYDFRKLQIENSAQDWQDYRNQILDFLQINKHEEVMYDRSFSQYCGLYLGAGYYADVYAEDQSLWINIAAFGRSSTRLIPVAENEFAFESRQITIRFVKNECNEMQSLEFIRALGGFQGGIAERFQPFELSEAELDLFCGDYRCESENLNRQIYQKDGSLYYLRSVNNKTRLLPTSKTKLAIGRSVSLDFDFTNDTKQFVFKAKDQEDSVFIQKPVHHNNHTNHNSDN